MSDRPRYPRSSCCVPGCRRTSTLFKAEWVCGEHWKLVDRQIKRFRTRRLKAIRHLIDRYEAKTRAAQARHLQPDGTTTDAPEIWAFAYKAVNAWCRWRRLEAAIWRRMKAQAIERAAGI